MTRGAFVAGGDELEEQVGGFGFEGDVADFVDDEERDSGRGGGARRGVGLGVWASPRRSTHSAAVANATRWPAWQARMDESDGEVGLAGAGRAEEHDVVALRR